MASLGSGYCRLSHGVTAHSPTHLPRSCDRVRDKIDVQQVKERHLFCRIAVGDRRQPFPGCCEQLVCKSREGGRMKRLSPEELPLLPDELPHQIEIVDVE